MLFPASYHHQPVNIPRFFWQAAFVVLEMVSDSGLSLSLQLHPDRCVMCAVRQQLQLRVPPLCGSRWWLTLGPKALRPGHTPRLLGLAAAGRLQRCVVRLHGEGLPGGTQVWKGCLWANLLPRAFQSHDDPPPWLVVHLANHRLFFTLLRTLTSWKPFHVWGRGRILTSKIP